MLYSTHTHYCQTPLRSCFAGMIFMAVIWSGTMHAQGKKEITDLEIEKLQHDDLMVLSQVLKTYQVKNMPASKALEQIWIQSVGRSPNIFLPEWRSEDKTAKEPLISLNLKDVPVKDVMRYISEIAASKLEIQGWHGAGIHLSLVHLTSNDDTELLVFVSTAELSEAGARLLGLKPNMTSAETVRVLRQFGVRFNDEKHPAAAYNAQARQITAILPYGESGYFKALARLANSGQIKPSHKP